MAPITRSDELRYANRARLLSCLRSRGSQSRKQLAEHTRLSAATVTQVTAQLLDEWIIIESSRDTADGAAPRPAADAQPSAAGARRGRPQVVLEINPAAAQVATVTVNFDRVEATLFDYAGKVLGQHGSAIRQSALDGEKLLQHIVATLRRALRQPACDTSGLRHITVACQGKVSKLDGNLLWSPLSKSQIIAVGAHMQRQFGVGVTVDNDCNMIASALYRSKIFADPPCPAASANAVANAGATADANFNANTGAAADANSCAAASAAASADAGNFATVLVSYGIGLGLIHDGAILTGSRSSGTELGHMQIAADGPLCRCGKRGCIEAYAADYAIWRRVRGLRADQLSEETIDPQTMRQIFAAAQASDGIERQALREAGTAIGHGLANLFAIFDSFPTRLVGLDQSAAAFVAEAINQRLVDSGDVGSDDIVSVHSSDSEIELIRRGAAMQCLNFVDQQIFSIGSPQGVANNGFQ